MQSTLKLEAKVQSPKQFDQVMRAFGQIAALGIPTSLTTAGHTAAAGRATARPRTTRASRPATAAARPRRGASAGVTRARAGNGKVSDEQMLSAIEGKDGISARQLAGELSISENTALRKLKEWEAAGKVTRSGQRNQTRWYAAQPALAA